MEFFFIQMSDTQIGMSATFGGPDNPKRAEMLARGLSPPMFEETEGFAFETENCEKAAAAANRLKPAFVVVTGDLVQDPCDDDLVAEFRRFAGLLDDDIPLHLAPGNCDVGNEPTPDLLALYRERFGADNYSFDHGGVHFVVFNTGIAFDPSLAPGEWEAQLEFLRSDLAGAGGRRTIAFGHHPLFGSGPDDADSAMVIPSERRRVILDLFAKHGVEAMFAGHWHRNNSASAGEFDMVVSGPVGVPLGDDPSGFRVVRVLESGLDHTYHSLDEAN